jgi:hypothetical protein
MNTDERFEPGTHIRLKGCGLPGRGHASRPSCRAASAKCPVGWVIAETDDRCRELVHADRFVVIEPEHA